MSTPNEPQDPYGNKPEQPTTPSGSPQYPSAPQYGSSQPGGYPAPPQYGSAPGYGGGYGQSYPKNSLGVWALVLGIVSLVLQCYFLTGIPAVIVGNKARKAAAAGEANNGGMALAGVILGWIGIALGVLLVVLFVVVIVAGGGFAAFMEGFEDGMNSSTY